MLARCLLALLPLAAASRMGPPADAAYASPFAGGAMGYASFADTRASPPYTQPNFAYPPPAPMYAPPGPPNGPPNPQYGAPGQYYGAPSPVYGPPNYGPPNGPPNGPGPDTQYQRAPLARITQDAERTRIVTPKAAIAISPPVMPATGEAADISVSSTSVDGSRPQVHFDAVRFRSALSNLLASLDYHGAESAGAANGVDNSVGGVAGVDNSAGGAVNTAASQPRAPFGNMAPRAPGRAAFEGETVCFPARSKIVARFLSRVSPASSAPATDGGPPILCYRAGDLRAAGVLA